MSITKICLCRIILLRKSDFFQPIFLKYSFDRIIDDTNMADNFLEKKNEKSNYLKKMKHFYIELKIKLVDLQWFIMYF